MISVVANLIRPFLSRDNIQLHQFVTMPYVIINHNDEDTWASASFSPSAFVVHRSKDTMGTVASRVWFCLSWRSGRAV